MDTATDSKDLGVSWGIYESALREVLRSLEKHSWECPECRRLILNPTAEYGLSSRSKFKFNYEFI